jgi:hypothetical protein
MKKLREFGVIQALSFFLGTLLPIGVWKIDECASLILSGNWYLPFAAAPLFALISTSLMVGRIGFGETFSARDESGVNRLSTFWAVLAIMVVINVLIALEAVLEA